MVLVARSGLLKMQSHSKHKADFILEKALTMALLCATKGYIRRRL